MVRRWIRSVVYLRRVRYKKGFCFFGVYGVVEIRVLINSYTWEYSL